MDSSHPPELLTVREAAKILRVSENTVRRIQAQRQITFFKIGGCVRFAMSDVFAYLEKQRVEEIS